MSYLNRKNKSICRHWCHRLNALKSVSTCSDPPSICLIKNLSRNFVASLTAQRTFFKLYVIADSQTDSCTNFCASSLSIPGPLTRAKTASPLVRVSFWRLLEVGDGARLRGAASRFQPCLDCHIVWPCMSESTESSACPARHHAPVN